jgi:hypothetical protein
MPAWQQWTQDHRHNPGFTNGWVLAEQPGEAPGFLFLEEARGAGVGTPI